MAFLESPVFKSSPNLAPCLVVLLAQLQRACICDRVNEDQFVIGGIAATLATERASRPVN